MKTKTASDYGKSKVILRHLPSSEAAPKIRVASRDGKEALSRSDHKSNIGDEERNPSQVVRKTGHDNTCQCVCVAAPFVLNDLMLFFLPLAFLWCFTLYASLFIFVQHFMVCLNIFVWRWVSDTTSSTGSRSTSVHLSITAALPSTIVLLDTTLVTKQELRTDGETFLD